MVYCLPRGQVSYTQAATTQPPPAPVLARPAVWFSLAPESHTTGSVLLVAFLHWWVLANLARFGRVYV